ncbi:hypothetical protein D3Y55_16125 [Mesorhizobium sp. DCY119]|nr:hypothetical protein D3Y55_16125 [Mesorhizobium sp. DCY119]
MRRRGHLRCQEFVEGQGELDLAGKIPLGHDESPPPPHIALVLVIPQQPKVTARGHELDRGGRDGYEIRAQLRHDDHRKFLRLATGGRDGVEDFRNVGRRISKQRYQDARPGLLVPIDQHIANSFLPVSGRQIRWRSGIAMAQPGDGRADMIEPTAQEKDPNQLR